MIAAYTNELFSLITNWNVQTWIRCTNLHSFSLWQMIDQIWWQKITFSYNFTKTRHTFTIILDTLACFYCKCVHYRFVYCILTLISDWEMCGFDFIETLLFLSPKPQTINSLWFVLHLSSGVRLFGIYY